MNIEPPAIPYDFADLEPAMSRDTLVFHYLRHQRVCYDRVRVMVRGTGLERLSLEELVRATQRDPALRALHRYAAEAWNHTVFWRSMRPRGGDAAHGRVGELLRRRFGSYQRFVRRFKAAASAHFGSGWLWLVWRNGTVEITATHDAGTPLGQGDRALLALDLWEHAYYLDHQNRRAAYVNAFLEELVGWEFANGVLAEIAECGEARGAPAATASLGA
ncbi:MAG TPA: Fe-Mn family superoxide dismutase [Steroidobacteraceae bacterium]|nr:Fe-Mn family superoxide dismutase [Steroidobacteraceae bacterium]